MDDAVLLHLIFCQSRMLLSKRHYADWRQIQTDYADYMASLGPWTATEVVCYFPLDYGDDDKRWPFTRKQITDFLRSNGETIIHHVA